MELALRANINDRGQSLTTQSAPIVLLVNTIINTFFMIYGVFHFSSYSLDFIHLQYNIYENTRYQHIFKNVPRCNWMYLEPRLYC